jgi:hypothetical protein
MALGCAVYASSFYFYVESTGSRKTDGSQLPGTLLRVYGLACEGFGKAQEFETNRPGEAPEPW